MAWLNRDRHDDINYPSEEEIRGVYKEYTCPECGSLTYDTRTNLPQGIEFEGRYYHRECLNSKKLRDIEAKIDELINLIKEG